MDDRHEGDVIPRVDDRKFAYHDENATGRKHVVLRRRLRLNK